MTQVKINPQSYNIKISREGDILKVLNNSISTRVSVSNFVLGVAGTGDMLRSVYDTDLNGIVDNSERLGGELPSYYLDSSNIDGNISDSQITSSPSWNSVYTTVLNNSTGWELTDIQGQEAYANLLSNSTNWENTYNTVDTYSPSWDSAYSSVLSNSTNWNTAYTNTHTHSNKSTLDVINQDLSSNSSPTFNALTIMTDLAVAGSSWLINAGQVSTSDNIIILNNGEVGSGVTAGSSGIQVDRGSSPDYQFIFDESSDSFKIGEVGSLQKVATREDSPTSGGVAFYNSSAYRFDTESNLYWDSSNNRLGINTITPSYAIDIASGGFRDQLSGTSTSTNSLNTRAIRPNSPSSYDIGQSTNPYNNIYVNNALVSSINITSSTDGQTLLRFNTDRQWSFEQVATGANTQLALRSENNDKIFAIQNKDKNNLAAFFMVTSTSTSNTPVLAINTVSSVSNADIFKVSDNSVQQFNVSRDYATFSNVLTGIDTTAPTHSLTMGSSSTGIALYNTADQTTNFERAKMFWNSNIFTIQTGSGGTGTARSLRLWVPNAASETSGLLYLEIARTGNTAFKFSSPNSPSQLSNGKQVDIDFTNSISSGVSTGLNVGGTINQSSTAGYTALLINPTETATGSGAKLLIDAQVGGNSKFAVTNTGNVGIGTTTPQSKLDVYTLNASTDVTQGLTITQADTGDALLQFSLPGVARWMMGIDNSDSDKFKISGLSTTGLDVNTRVSIDSNGLMSVGSATSAVSNTKLDVGGYIRTALSSSFGAVYFTSSSTNPYINYGAVSNAWTFGDTNSVKMTVDAANSRVGIGTSSPSYKLSVTSSDFINTQFTRGAVSGYVGVSATDGLLLGAATTATSMMTLLSNGSVGIGTASPTSRLHVTGDIKIAGTGTNVMTLSTGSAGTFDRLDFSAGTTNLGASFQLVPNGTNTKSKLVLSNSSSTTNFGSVYLGLEGADAYITSQSVGSGYTTASTLHLGTKAGSSLGGANWTSVVVPGGNFGIGTTSPTTLLQVHGSGTPGTGEATYPGYMQISGVGGATSSIGGLEFKTSGSGSGYGWKISGPDEGAGSTPLLIMSRNNSASWTESVRVTNTHSMVLGNAAVATNATNGFLYITSCAGTPTGVPTTFTGRTPMVYDTTNNKFYIYNSGWKGVTLS